MENNFGNNEERMMGEIGEPNSRRNSQFSQNKNEFGHGKFVQKSPAYSSFRVRLFSKVCANL